MPFVLARAGLAEANHEFDDIFYPLLGVAIGLPVLFLFVWYLPDMLQMIYRLIYRRRFAEEAEYERRMEGKILDPDYLRSKTLSEKHD